MTSKPRSKLPAWVRAAREIRAEFQNWESEMERMGWTAVEISVDSLRKLQRALRVWELAEFKRMNLDAQGGDS